MRSSSAKCQVPSAQCLLVLLLLCAPAHAVELIFDAAEQDQSGVPFVGYSAARFVLDNRGPAPGAANANPPADVTGMRFRLDWTVIPGAPVYGFGPFFPSSDSPWYGVATPSLGVQTVGDYEYRAGDIYYPPTHEFAPFWLVTNTKTGEFDELRDAVPGGVVWDVRWKIQGYQLFHSPAVGHVASASINETLYDADRGPQTAPEPATAGLFALAGALLAWKRRLIPKRPKRLNCP